MLDVSDIRLHFGGRLIFESASFRIEDGERAAIVGPNGSGKSTMLRIVAGIHTAEAGAVSIPNNSEVGYLPQEMEFASNRTVGDECREISREVIEQVVADQGAKVCVDNQWEDGPHPVYEISHHGRRLAFYHPGVGAPLAAGLLEEAIAFGCRKFIACGGCGVLQKDIPVGDLVVVSAAVRDEGVSYHYLPPSRTVTAQSQPMAALQTTLARHGLPHLTGATWTTDATSASRPTRCWAPWPRRKRSLRWWNAVACSCETIWRPSPRRLPPPRPASPRW